MQTSLPCAVHNSTRVGVTATTFDITDSNTSHKSRYTTLSRAKASPTHVGVHETTLNSTQSTTRRGQDDDDADVDVDDDDVDDDDGAV